MSNDDMDTPVTRRELREELRELEDRLDARIRHSVNAMGEQNRQYTDTMAEQNRQYVDTIVARIGEQNRQYVDTMAEQNRQYVDTIVARIGEQNRQYTNTMAEQNRQYMNTIADQIRGHFGTLDDKYSSLPGRTDAVETAVAELAPRVAVLERKVFAPAKQPVAKRRRR
jgi:hypothetical protein